MYRDVLYAGFAGAKNRRFTGMYCMPVSPKAPTFGAGAKNRRCTGNYRF
jgi:hypothetical protein